MQPHLVQREDRIDDGERATQVLKVCKAPFRIAVGSANKRSRARLSGLVDLPDRKRFQYLDKKVGCMHRSCFNEMGRRGG